jgi:glycolate oxidase FAD binding subunit
MADSDTTGRLQSAVASALEASTPLQIRAGGSKDFYGRTPTGELLDVGDHRGVISYQPSELVITARAGTPLAELEKTLAENHQLLPFEPPHFSRAATIGGTIACGLSGPRRPWGGAVRDLVLGTRIINGRGEVLRFGGEVIKNVAGYDVSRLMTGALGTLGVILDVSMKVLPIPEAEITLAFEIDASTAIETIGEIAGTACPLSGAMHFDGGLYLRLSGARAGVDAAFKKLGGELQTHDELWRQLRDHSLPFFAHEGRNLWRLSVPPATP